MPHLPQWPHRPRRAPPEGQPWITVREAAARLGVAERTVVLHLQQRKLDGQRIGKAWRVSPASVDRILGPAARVRGWSPR